MNSEKKAALLQKLNAMKEGTSLNSSQIVELRGLVNNRCNKVSEEAKEILLHFFSKKMEREKNKSTEKNLQRR